MPIRYISKREQVQKFVGDVILPIIAKRDVDEEKMIAWIVSKTNAAPKLIKEVIENHITLRQIKRIEGGVLTIPDEAVIDFLKETKPIDAEKEADAVLK